MKIEKLSKENESALFALELLGIFAFFHFGGICDNIFRRARMSTDYRRGCVIGRSCLHKLMPSGWDQLTFNRALKVLVDFSLITIDQSRRITIHPLVHEWSRERMSEGARELACDMAISILAFAMVKDYPTWCSHEDQQHRKSMLPHVNACIASPNYRERLFVAKVDLEERLFAAARFAITFREAGRYRVALELDSRILKMQETFMPPGDAALIHSSRMIAIGLNHLSRYNEAVEIWQSLLKETRQTTGDGSIDTIRVTQGLAFTYQHLGQYEIAVKMMEKVFLGFRNILGSESTETLVAKSFLANCFCAQKKWKRGVKLQEEVLEVYKRTLPSNHPFALIQMDSLAISYHALGRSKEGRKLREQAITAMETTFGENHPGTLIAITNSTTGHTWPRRNNNIEVQTQVLRKLQENLGDSHVDTLATTSKLAKSYFEIGALMRAKMLQEKALTGLIEIYGDEHPELVGYREFFLVIQRAIALRKVCYWWVPKRLLK
jgi:tetratricopeptide (TPR) repeat protein